MNRNLQILKKTVLTLAILLMTTASAWALEINFTQNGQNISTNYTASPLGEGVTINVPSGFTCTYSGIISGGSTMFYTTIKKTGAGKLIITNANTVSGSTITVSDGTLQLGNGTTNGSFNNMTNFEISSGATLRFEPKDDNMKFNKVIKGAGKVEYKGLSGNSLYLTETNTYTGGTTVESGYLCIGDGTTGSIVGNVTVQSGAYLTFCRSNEYTFSGIISGKGGAGKSRVGKTILTGANTYEGKTYINAGALQIGNGTSTTATIGTTSNVEIGGDGTLRFEPGAAMIFSKVISGEGMVVYSGATTKKLYFSANNTYTGGTYIQGGGHLHIGNNGTSGSIKGNINVGTDGYLTFYRTDTYTYSGIISGAGNVCNFGSGKTILTGVNTYSGNTLINGGTLQVGNGTSGSIANTSGVEVYSGKTLRFEPGAAMIFPKVISGTGGNVEYKGASNKQLIFTGNNTYTGTTTIIEGTLYIGNETTTGSISGNIINNGSLRFFRSNAYTYKGVISGTGSVQQGIYSHDAGTLTLDGVNTYTGETYIYSPLSLSAKGSIEKSSQVTLLDVGAKFNIAAGNKKIKALVSDDSDNQVVLGSSTLTIGTAGQNDGNGEFLGKFTGTGGNVTKTGTATFTMSGANTATGTFTHSQGTVNFSGSWAGKYNKEANTTLTVTGNPTIGGTLTLVGGTINMNLKAAKPSKITVNGAVIASGTNTLKITTDVVTNYVLIQAASGVPETWPYTVSPMSGFDAELWANGTQLMLSTKVGIEELGVANFRVYPNPTTGELTINNEQLTINNVEIYDIYGKKLSFNHLIISSSNHQINISHFPAGIYFLRIQTENKMITQKIIKQ